MTVNVQDPKETMRLFERLARENKVVTRFEPVSGRPELRQLTVERESEPVSVRAAA